MDLNDAAVFSKVVEAGSFTGAATLLHHPKSSVSRTVARLEEQLGVRLLQRTTRSLSLTEAGQAFYDRVRGAVQGLEEAASAAREFGGEPRGAVRFTAPPDSQSRLHEVIVRFVAKYPAIHVELSLTPRFVDLVSEGFDLALRAGKLADSRLVARKIGASRQMFFAAPSYLKRRGRPRSVAELAEHDCVLFRGQGGRARWLVTRDGDEASVDVKGPINVDDLSFAKDATIGGAGVGFLPILTVVDALHRGELELLLPEYQSKETPLHLLVPSATFIPMRVTLLRDFVADHFERMLAEIRTRCSQNNQHRRVVTKPRAKR
jgi:DNA-binding transcriptional LysR family regulator